VSSAQEAVELLENAIKRVVPLLIASRNYYDLEKNDGVKNAYVFAIRPSSASPVTGVTRSVTIEQEFELEIEREFLEKGSTDLAIREAVERIYNDNELIIKEVSHSKTTNILKVGEPSFSAPKINQNEKTVSIVFSYPITYRKQIN
jgi:hypothetical protein